MCGIIGVLGASEAAPRITAGLKRLEYRCYDSAGVATVNEGRLDRRRAPPKAQPFNRGIGIDGSTWLSSSNQARVCMHVCMYMYVHTHIFIYFYMLT